MKLKHFLFLAVIVVLPLMFSLASPRFAENLRLFTYSLLKPVLQVTETLSFTSQHIFYKVRDYHKVYKENESFKARLMDAEKKLIQFQEIAKENERFKGLLDFKKEIESKSVAARIIARDISYWSHWVVLDKGQDDGVYPGMILANGQGLVGRVVSAGKHVARGILIIDGESRVSVMVQTSRDVGLLEGRGDEAPMIKLLSLDSTVKAGDAVITSGLGGTYPKGIPVGVINTVVQDRDGLHRNATLKLFADMNRLEEVLCLSITVPS